MLNRDEMVRRSIFGSTQYELLVEDNTFVAVADVADPSEEQVRKEYQKETDLSYLLEAFTAGRAFPRVGVAGEVDYDVDRLSALLLLEESHQLFSKLPKELRERFPTWQAIEAANASGELYEFLNPKKEEPPVS